MSTLSVVSHADWLAARRELLAKEKEFSRLRDELSARRRALPWEKVEKAYVFEGPGGDESLVELFGDCCQLIVYHFMFGPDWEEGCKACSFLTDHFGPALTHLNNRDVTLIAVSRGPLEKLQAFRERMGWPIKWVSSLNNDFNGDYGVSFSPEDMAAGEVDYNYATGPFPVSEGPGISVFAKDGGGDVFHTYSSYASGLDMFIGTYHLLDIVPKGRGEAELPFSMDWVRHHDRYGD